MASQPTFPIANPQYSNTTTASSQSLSSFINHVSSKFRPWSELIEPNSFSRPGTLSEAYSRVLINHFYFMTNYVTVICVTLAHSLATDPLYLLFFVVLSFWTFICLSRTSPHTVVLFGRTFSETKTLGALVVAAVFLTDIISLLTSGLMLGLAIVLTHAAFRVPDQELFILEQEPNPDRDLFLHEQEHNPDRDLFLHEREPSPDRDLFLHERDRDLFLHEREPGPDEDLFILEREPGPDQDLFLHDQELSSAGLSTNFIPVVSENPSSSSSSPPPPTKHDVFLSFRGEDSRYSFTSHLYAELRSKNIETFIDDKLGKGKLIWSELQTAIEESMIYVIIFSQRYASSKWCLDELTTILECKEKYGRTVIPVFYNVDPSTIRHQRGSYADDLVKHEKRYKEKVPGWKRALTEAAALSGWDLNTIRSESELVTKIVEDILRRLNNSPSSDYKGLIGIPEHITQIQSLLHLESAAVRVIGIWGIGGIGKTTIAGALYHKLATQFSFRSFVANFEEDIKRYGGIHRMQEKYLSELLVEKPGDSRGLRLEQKLKRGKVLLILDNVNSSAQLQDLIGGLGRFGPGSRIIVISRDMQVLKNAADETHEVKEMTFHDSLHLFSLYAFKQNYPIETYMDLSEKVLNHAKGIPLALKILGSLLYGRTRGEWESELQKLEKRPDDQIVNVLKLSYVDGLDDEQKHIFLDIACFYRGHDMNTVKQTLDDSGFSAAIGMIVLVDRGLISILNGKIVMHDLIQQMGQEIVYQQGEDEPGKRSRLWKHEDIYHVLAKKKGTDAIRCIFLDMCKIEKVELHADTFKMMHNLIFLQFYKSNLREDSKVYVPASLESLPDKLRFLRWDGFPQGSLPLNFCPRSLVKLDMRDSRLEQLWEGDQHLPNLRRMDLSGSRKLIQIPDLSQSPNIEELILSNCVQLGLVYSSSFLSKLNCLILNGCVRLRSLNLPSNILSRYSGLVVLYNCRNLESFSVSNITEGVPIFSCLQGRVLKRHHLEMKKDPGIPHYKKFASSSNTFDPVASSDIFEENIDIGFKEFREGLSPMFPNLNERCWLDLSNCVSLTSLPNDLCNLKFLRRLNLSGCLNLESFPEIEETMEYLAVLILDQTAIQKLPSSLHNLVGLEELSLNRCEMLEFIPSSIGSLSKLSKLDLTYCESLETIPSSIFKLKLTKLDLHGCSMLRNFPEIMEFAENLKHLRLTKTAIKEMPPSLEYLVGLRTLRLNLCRDFKNLPDSIVNLNLLTELDCSGCTKLTKIPNDISRFSSLSELSLSYSGIVKLPGSIAHLSSLKSLDLSDCERLECIPELPPFLKQLLAFDCPCIRTVMSSARFEVPSDSKQRIFKFYLTNSRELDPSAHSNIVADAWRRVTQDAYKSVFFCFPGSAVPHWFPYQCKGRSVTLNTHSLTCCSGNRFIGFALCVVLGLEAMDEEVVSQPFGMYDAVLAHEGVSVTNVFSCRFIFETDDEIRSLPNHDDLRSYFIWKGRERFIVQDHTFMWTYYLDTTSISHVLSGAHNFTFEICKNLSPDWSSFDDISSTIKVKECGICPLFTKGKDDDASAHLFQLSKILK